MLKGKELSLTFDQENFLSIFKGFSDALRSIVEESPERLQMAPLVEFLKSLSKFLEKSYSELLHKQNQSRELLKRVDDYFDMKKRHTNSLAELEEVTTTLKRREHDLEDLKNSFQTLIERAKLLEKEKIEYEEKYTDLNPRFQELKQKNRQDEAKIKMLQEDLKTIEKEHKTELNKAGVTFKRENAETLKGLEKKIAELEQERKELLKVQEKLEINYKKELKEGYEKLHKLEQEKVEKEKALAAFGKKYNQEREQFKQENLELQKDIEECQKLIIHQNEHIQDLKEELSFCQNKLFDSQQDSSRGFSNEELLKIKIATKEMYEMNIKVKKLNNIVNKLTAENHSLKSKLDYYIDPNQSINHDYNNNETE